MRGTRKGIHQFAEAHRLRIDQMETMAVQPLFVGDVIHGVCHEIDRNDIDAAAFDTQCRHPLRQGLSDFLDQREQIIGAVDFIDFTGFGMADHH